MAEGKISKVVADLVLIVLIVLMPLLPRCRCCCCKIKRWRYGMSDRGCCIK